MARGLRADGRWERVAGVRCARYIRLILIVVTLLAARVADAQGEADRVVVVANERDPESLEVARHYMAARGIPEANLVLLPMSTKEAVSWGEFISEILDPLRGRLTADGWLEGIASPLRDEYGRRRFISTGNRIAYLVLCRGVPLKIEQNADWTAGATKPGLNPGLLVNSASVDSELSTMAMNGTAVNGQIPNPLFRVEENRQVVLDPVVRVARLDGPTAQAARDLVDNALAAERAGIAGRAYVDLSGWNPLGDDWLEKIAKVLDEAGFDVDIDRERPVMPAYARFDAPAFYFGWYDWNLKGPMAVPGFHFPPGAIAVHIHSYSAETLRSETQNWAGPLVARGATATLGNVHEPYLQLTHRLDMFFSALMEGRTFGVAGFYSTPVLSWQGVLVGDPLYRPFAVDLDHQWANRAAIPATLRTAVVSRKVRLLLRADDKTGAVQLARAQFRESPSLASGLLLAQTVAAIDGPQSAPQHLRFISMLDQIDPRELGIALQAAQALTGWGAHGDAFAVYKRALASTVPAWADEAAIIQLALNASRNAGVTEGVAALQARLSLLRAPPANPQPGG